MFCARRRKKREPLPFADDRKRKCSFPAVGKNVPLAKTLKRAVTADVVGLREALSENRLHRRDLRHGSGEIPTSLFGKRICVTGSITDFRHSAARRIKLWVRCERRRSATDGIRRLGFGDAISQVVLPRPFWPRCLPVSAARQPRAGQRVGPDSVSAF